MNERETIIKLLALTTSEHDGEALSAIRKANVLLARAKLTWAWLIDGKPDHQAEPRDIEADEINEAFDKLRHEFEEPQTDFWKFIQSLEHVWLNRGALSEKQKAALLKTARRYVPPKRDGTNG